MSFFERTGYGSGNGEPRRVEEFIERMRADWVEYDVKFTGKH
jgi:hypothetical protein